MKEIVLHHTSFLCAWTEQKMAANQFQVFDIVETGPMKWELIKRITPC